MKVSEKDVQYVSALAQLQLTEEEQGRMLRDLNSILDYVERLNQLDTSDIPPMSHVSSTAQAESGGSAREDILFGLRPSLPHDEAMANAPESDGTFFIVPKVIER